MKKIMLVNLFIILNQITMAQTDSKYFVDENNVAIKGYDLVAYANQNTAVKGDLNYSSEYDGVKWFFSSAENKAAFEETPSKYLPAYGGYCAFAMAAKMLKSLLTLKRLNITMDNCIYFSTTFMMARSSIPLYPGTRTKKI